MPQYRYPLRAWTAPLVLLVLVAVLLGALRGMPAGHAGQGAAGGRYQFDVIIRNGTVYDGTGAAGVKADVGILLDRIAAVGDLGCATAATIVDANGLAVAPGFINMLSWSTESLLVDGRALGGIRQGVTTEIMGEGSSMGPLNPEMKQRALDTQTHLKFDIRWTTLAEYLQHLEARGISPTSPRSSAPPRSANT